MKKDISFSEENFHSLCDKLAKKDNDLKQIIQQHGYPPLWSRKPCFETLIHFILEQQVSLASAKAALQKLKLFVGEITLEKILLLTDEEMKACYFSRQKIIYARALATSIKNGGLIMENLHQLSNEKIRTELKKIKGIGDWTVDVFLMMSLHRCDCFAIGDIALVKSIKDVKKLSGDATKESILQVAQAWKPYRTIAAYLLWHNYLEKRNSKRIAE
ncbi:MAG: DNA-3-methyladenine glycosylase family protein [Chitinophagaceae bacterium]